MLSRGIENAQRRIESRNFDLRKNLLEYDDVANDQRQAVYSLRDQLLFEDNISENIQSLIEEVFTNITLSYFPKDSIESQWRPKEIDDHLADSFGINLDISKKIEDEKSWYVDDVISFVVKEADIFYRDKYSILGENIHSLERQVMLQVLDAYWKEHLAEMDHLRQSIGLRAYAQKNPKNEYKREAYEMFGISFTNHPNLEKLYLPDGYEGNPMLKSFELISREVKPWPGEVDVEGMPEESESDESADG